MHKKYDMVKQKLNFSNFIKTFYSADALKYVYLMKDSQIYTLNRNLKFKIKIKRWNLVKVKVKLNFFYEYLSLLHIIKRFFHKINIYKCLFII